MGVCHLQSESLNPAHCLKCAKNYTVRSRVRQLTNASCAIKLSKSYSYSLLFLTSKNVSLYPLHFIKSVVGALISWQTRVW